MHGLLVTCGKRRRTKKNRHLSSSPFLPCFLEGREKEKIQKGKMAVQNENEDIVRNYAMESKSWRDLLATRSLSGCPAAELEDT